MKDNNQNVDRFSAPIPGGSLTLPPGGAKYEQPPQFNDPEDALEYTFNNITHPRQSSRIIELLKSGATVESIARTMAFQGFSSGKWTPDMALAIARPMMWQIAGVAGRAVKNGWIDESKVKLMNPDKDQIEFMMALDKGEQPMPEAAATVEPAPSDPQQPPQDIQFGGILGGLQK